MPALVFPSIGSIGSIYQVSVPRLTRRYDDGTKRSYLKSATLHRMLTLSFTNQSKAKRDTIQAFIEARLLDNAQFFIYSPQETGTLDLLGVATLGRHTADEIIGDTFAWTADTKCGFSGQLQFYLIN